MSLYGALFAGVSGLKAQSNKIGVISDNIANVNTIGYKAINAQFESLVVSTSTTVSYSPGGVLANNRLTVDKQGLLLATDAPTDIAISGDGFFVVKPSVDSDDLPLYTRAGSFRKDQLGNFVNAAGYYLQGWPIDRDGRLPATSASLDSLETVNIDSASGQASATTTVSIGANFDARETVYPGQDGVIDMDNLSTANFGINATTIIAPAEFGIAPTNSIARLDQFTVRANNALAYTYQYGGFTIGRDVTVAGYDTVNARDNNYGDSTATIFDSTTLAAPGPGVSSAATDGATNVVTITSPNHGLISGDIVTLSGFAGAFGGIPAAQLNATHIITRIDANTFTVTVTSNSTSVAATNGTQSMNTRQFSGNVFDATNEFSAFLGDIGVTGFTTAARQFTINTPTTGTMTFRYVTTSPSAVAGEFNNLSSLAAAIDNVEGLSARVEGGRLMVGAENANEAVTFANGDTVGNATQRGLDWISELGLVNISGGSRRFSTLQGLADLVNQDQGVSAEISNALADASLTIRVDDPKSTIQFLDYVEQPGTPLINNPMSSAGGPAASSILVTVTDSNHNLAEGQRVAYTGLAAFGGFTLTELNATHTIVNVIDANTYQVAITSAAGGAATVGGSNTGFRSLQNNGSLLAEFGLTDSLNGAAYTTRGDTGILGPRYDAGGAGGLQGDNMASGNIEAQFSRTFQVYDSLGSVHNLRLSVIKIDTNKWAAELFAVPATDISGTLPDGQVAFGEVEFNGDGSLKSIDSELSGEIEITWTNGAVPSNITIDWGTAGAAIGTLNATRVGDTDGLSQFASDYNVSFLEQNGAPVGELVGISVDNEGVVIASFSNGDVQRLYKIPLADFANPNGLNPRSGNVYAATRDSGEVNLREAGTNGTGTVLAGSLEGSNVELSEQLTDLIVAQRAYQSNTRAISAADDLLEELNRL
jgi:flagellar hook-basal body protein